MILRTVVAVISYGAVEEHGFGTVDHDEEAH